MCLTIVRQEFDPPISTEVMAWNEVRVEQAGRIRQLMDRRRLAVSACGLTASIAKLD
jgi:hypothetical protein